MHSFSYILTATALAAPIVSAQLSGLPSCAQSALSPAESALNSTGCSLTDIKCLCQHSNTFISAVAPSLEAACSASDLQKIVNFTQNECSSQGVSVSVPASLTSYLSGAATASGTSSSGSISMPASNSAAAPTGSMMAPPSGPSGSSMSMPAPSMGAAGSGPGPVSGPMMNGTMPAGPMMNGTAPAPINGTAPPPPPPPAGVNNGTTPGAIAISSGMKTATTSGTATRSGASTSTGTSTGVVSYTGAAVAGAAVNALGALAAGVGIAVVVL